MERWLYNHNHRRSTVKLTAQRYYGIQVVVFKRVGVELVELAAWTELTWDFNHGRGSGYLLSTAQCARASERRSP